MDTTAARRSMLARIRAAQGRDATPAAHEREAVADYLARHPQGPRPPMEGDLVARFVVEAKKMASTVEEVAQLADVPAAAARYLASLQLPTQAVAWETLESFDWTSAGLTVAFRKPEDRDLVGLTGCFCATAETGTLVLLSGPQTWA
ncbi:hypothetical protein R2R70_18945, partial [Cobetia sp. SIMBA_158]